MLRAGDILRRRLEISSRLLKYIRLYGELLCNGEHWRMIDPVAAGSELTIIYEADNELPENTVIEAAEDIDIVYQDEWLLVVSKPADLLTHPSYLGETRALTTRLTPHTLHPVSRLDRDTSGLIILGKNGFAHDRLSSTAIRKRYLAFVHGQMPEPSGLIDAAIARSPDSIITREVNPDGQTAQTKYSVRATARHQDGSIFQILELELLTGRTHQIRVHCEHLGHPLIGDDLYIKTDLLEADRQMGRQALHAYSLEFTHPFNRLEMNEKSPLPKDMSEFLENSTLLDGSYEDSDARCFMA